MFGQFVENFLFQLNLQLERGIYSLSLHTMKIPESYIWDWVIANKHVFIKLLSLLVIKFKVLLRLKNKLKSVIFLESIL